MIRTAVAGSSGFIGSHLVRALSRRDDTEVITIDITDGLDLTKSQVMERIPQFDTFIYLAGLSFIPDSFSRPHDFYRTNYLLTLNALELCRKYRARMLMISSYVYGEPEYLPVDEGHPVRANSPYIQTKLISEQLCLGYCRDFDVKCTVLRPFNVFGPGQKGSFLIPAILKQVRPGNAAVKLQNPAPRRDFVYVSDLCDAIVKVAGAEYAGYEVFNIASGSSHSVLETCQAILQLTGRTDMDISFDEAGQRRNDILEIRGSYDKIQRQYGWKPGVSFREGLQLIVEAEVQGFE